MACGLSQDGLRAVHSSRLQEYIYIYIYIYMYINTCFKAAVSFFLKKNIYIYIYGMTWLMYVAPAQVRAMASPSRSRSRSDKRSPERRKAVPEPAEPPRWKKLKKGAEKGEAAADQASARARAHQQSVRAQGRQEAALRRIGVRKERRALGHVLTAKGP